MKTQINNELYHDLGDRWYEASDDPVALLRAEANVKNPWVIDLINKELPHLRKSEISVLDLGCGAGFLSNALSRDGYRVTGVDLSENSLEVAKKHDSSGRVSYCHADAYEVPYANGTFDVVTCMDFLEHVENPAQVVQEAARVLKKDGIFIFHTFNRNYLSGLIVIKGLEWVVKNTPPNLHILRLFIKPKEMLKYCRSAGLIVHETVAISPVIDRAFLKTIATGVVSPDFSFRIGKKPKRNPLLGYLGFAIKSLPSLFLAGEHVTNG